MILVIDLKYNLDNNGELISFLNNLFTNKDLVDFAPLIMKFFIITRNYGLINYDENISILETCDKESFMELCLKVIKDGFNKDNITYNNGNLTKLLINNYHDNGFYFHSFPGIYKDSINELGLLANNRNNNDDKYFEIAKKYHFGSYFENSNNRICLTEKITNNSIKEYALYTPEWLEMFLKQGNYDIHDIYRKGDIKELEPIIENSLQSMKIGMQRNEFYDENDYIFLCSYIKEVVNKRFINGNNLVGIVLIEKRNSDDYFKKHIENKDIEDFNRYIESHKMNDHEIYDFIIETISNGKVETERNIPRHLINIVSYEVFDKELERTKK